MEGEGEEKEEEDEKKYIYIGDQEKKGLSQAHNALVECSFIFWVLFRRGCRLISLIDLPFE